MSSNFRQNFQSKSVTVIPFTTWSTGGRVLNKEFTIPGKQLSFGVLGDEFDGGANEVEPIFVIHFSPASGNLVNYRVVGNGANSPGVNVLLPPSEFVTIGAQFRNFVFEEEFDQFFLSFDPGLSPPTGAGDFVIIISDCPSSIKFAV